MSFLFIYLFDTAQISITVQTLIIIAQMGCDNSYFRLCTDIMKKTYLQYSGLSEPTLIQVSMKKER